MSATINWSSQASDDEDNSSYNSAAKPRSLIPPSPPLLLTPYPSGVRKGVPILSILHQQEHQQQLNSRNKAVINELGSMLMTIIIVYAIILIIYSGLLSLL